MSGYDAWLERPYVEAARRQDDYERWCEQTGHDPDDESNWSEFEQATDDAEQAYEDDLAEQAELDRLAALDLHSGGAL